MRLTVGRRIVVTFVCVLGAALGILRIGIDNAAAAPVKKAARRIPKFEFDPSWPKQEGHFGEGGNWIFGALGGIAVDTATDHVWVVQRPASLIVEELLATTTPPQDDCCIPAPTVMEFDGAGNFIQGWGGPGKGFEWPETEHSIRVDYQGNVWIGGAGPKDNQLLKFTKAGKFLLQIGHAGKTTGIDDKENMNTPSSTFVYPKTNEVFVSDGYFNRRVVVFDANTGAFKRMWGAYGKKADNSVPRIKRFPLTEGLPLEVLLKDPPPQQFNLPHAILVSNDGLVYVGDRTNNRIQVFNADGTFVKEAFVERSFLGPVGTVVDMAFSPDREQQFLYVMSGDERLRTLDRNTLEILGAFGHLGHFPGQFFHTHAIATDSKGNIYTAEASKIGRRIEKFAMKGYTTVSPRP